VRSQDLDKDDYVPEPYQPGPVEEVFELHKQDQARKRTFEKTKQKKMQALGFEGDVLGDGIL